MKVPVKLFVCLALVLGRVAAALSAQVTPETMLNTTLDTWTTVDMVRSIAREDRHHLYPRLIKANLDLYATTFWFTDHCPKNLLSDQYVDEITDIFKALATAQKDTLTGQSISDDAQAPLLAWNPSLEVPLQQKHIGGLLSCMLMDYTNSLWNNFIAYHAKNPTKSS